MTSVVLVNSVFCAGILCCTAAMPVSSQNLSSLGKEKALVVTGGVSLNQIVYAANGIGNRRSPYT